MYTNAKGLELKVTSTGTERITGPAGGVRTGTAGADLFHGAAGETLVGGLGDDVYNLWDSSAKISEKAGEGVDTAYVRYWSGHQLAEGVENAVLLTPGGTWATGNSLNNVLIAGDMHATLNGGAGDDVLVGGAGADVFKVVAGAGSDAIYNFKPGWDAVSLKGYSFTSFDQLKTAASQIGSDVSIKLSSTESLVLRDVQLGDLSAADFALPMPKITALAPNATYQYGSNRALNVNGWTVFSNAWGVGDMVEGKDFALNSAFSASNMTKGTTFTWSFALNTDYSQSIKTYPEIIFGNGPMNPVRVNPTDTKLVLPVKVADLVSLTSTHDVSYAGNTGGFNVAYDIWLTSVANGDRSTLTNEVMVWVHEGDFPAFGAQVGTYTDPGGHTAKIYHQGTYTAVVFDKDLPKATIDIAGIFETLGDLGYVHPNEYVGSIELGAEVVSGAGSLTVKDMQLRVETKGADGSTTLKTVTGSGTSVVVTPASESLLDKLYDAGATALIDAMTGRKLGLATTVTTADSVMVTKTDLVGKSLGKDVAKMDGARVSVDHYDGAGKLQSVDKVSVGADGAFTIQHYSAAGDLLGSEKQTTAANGAVTTQHFDDLGKLTGSEKVSVAGGATTTAHYDAKSVLTGSEVLTNNADGSTTLRHLDNDGAVTAIDVAKSLGATVTLFHYSPSLVLKGAEVATTEASGATKVLVYNAAWQVLEARYEGTDRADTLTGLGIETHLHGGLGSDQLTGSIGADYFHLDTAIGQGDVDTISGFTVGQDKIALDHEVFTTLKVGDLDQWAFRAGPAKAADATDRIVFDKTTGQLWYDDDGQGAHAPILLAKVTGGVALTAADFIVT